MPQKPVIFVSAVSRELQSARRVLGAEHPDPLASRNNLATALAVQDKFPEAKKELRTVLALRERVRGAKHPDVFKPCFDLALCLESQGEIRQALDFMRRAESGWQKALGAEHPDSRDATQIRDRLEAKLKEGKTP